VRPVREVAGEEISQVLIGSSANPGLRDFEVVARIAEGEQTHDGVSFDVNPTSRQTLEALARSGAVETLVAAGARLNARRARAERAPSRESSCCGRAWAADR
jgi:aconitate hydratase